MDAATLDRYVDALERIDLELPKELWVRLEAPASDALADALDHAIDELGGRLHFAIMDDALVTWAKVRGNPWDLHDVLGELRALSARLPLFAFALQYDPDGSVGRLRAGRYEGVPVEPLARWVERFPRPDLAGSITRARITVVATTTAHEQIRDTIAGHPAVTLDVTPHGVTIDIAHPSSIAYAVDTTLRPLILLDEPWRCELALAGAFEWQRTVSSFEQRLALECLLATALPVEPGAAAAPPPLELPVLAELAAFCGDETLELEDRGQRVAIAGDGTTRPASPAVRHRSADDRYAATRDRWIDRTTGVTRELRARPPSLRPLGFVDDDLVLVESTLRVGRSKYRIVVLHPDGTEHRTRAFINAGAIALDPLGARVVMTAERDGAAQLVEIAVPSFAETTVLPQLDDRDVPHDLLVVGSDVIGVFATTRTETTFRRLIRDRGFEPFTRVPGGLESAIERDGNDVYLYTTEHVANDADGRVDPDRARSRLYRVSLDDGAVTAAGSIDEPGRPAMCEHSGAWRAWLRHGSDTIQIVEGIALRARFALPAGHQIWSFAVSSRGTLAVVGRSGDRAYLRVVRGARDVEQALPRPITVDWAPAGPA